MKVLLDTVAFLWWVADDDQLPATARIVIANPANVILFSAASAWEIAIKAGLGRLKVRKRLSDWISVQLRKNHLISLPVSVRHAAGVSRLPAIHRDPFDRILVSQARIERCRILTNDPEIQKYAVPVLW